MVSSDLLDSTYVGLISKEQRWTIIYALWSLDHEQAGDQKYKIYAYIYTKANRQKNIQVYHLQLQIFKKG